MKAVEKRATNIAQHLTTPTTDIAKGRLLTLPSAPPETNF